MHAPRVPSAMPILAAQSQIFPQCNAESLSGRSMPLFLAWLPRPGECTQPKKRNRVKRHSRMNPNARELSRRLPLKQLHPRSLEGRRFGPIANLAWITADAYPSGE